MDNRNKKVTNIPTNKPSFHITPSKVCFGKRDLKNEWAVKTRSGVWYRVLKIAGYGTAFVASDGEVRSARQWRSDLTSKSDKADDIVLVAQPTEMTDVINERFERYQIVVTEKPLMPADSKDA